MKHEINLIGSVIEIIGSENKDCIGIKGKVIDETKNVIFLSDSKKVKKILKNEVMIKMPQGEIINGKDISGDIVSRLKQKNKNKKSKSKLKNKINDKKEKK